MIGCTTKGLKDTALTLKKGHIQEDKKPSGVRFICPLRISRENLVSVFLFPWFLYTPHLSVGLENGKLGTAFVFLRAPLVTWLMFSGARGLGALLRSLGAVVEDPNPETPWGCGKKRPIQYQ